MKRISLVTTRMIIAWSGLLLLAAGCGGNKDEAGTEIIRPVRYVQVFASGGERVRSFSGISQAGKESRLSFKVPGNITRLAVAVGDPVDAGDLIARIDPDDYRLQVEEAEANLNRAQAQSRNANAQLDRVRGLYENQHTSLNDLDAAQTAYDVADAAVRSADKGLAQARNQLGYTELKAPVAGDIARVLIEENENVGAGQAVVVLTSGDQADVLVSVPEILIAQIREGEDVDVALDAIPGRQFAAKIIEVGVSATGTATTYPVKVRLAGQHDGIRPGMAAEVRFSFSSESGRERIIVPPVSVGEDRSGRFIFVVEDMKDGIGTARRRNVRVGELLSGGIEITEGLADGEWLVTAGVNKLTDGRSVRLGTSQGSGQ